jgi:acyl carrier protein
MNGPQRIRSAVYRTIDAVNDLLPGEEPLAANDATILVGSDASLDSMGFVNFIVALEEELEREFGREVNMADLLNLQDDEGTTTISTVADLIKVVSTRLG